MKIIKYVLIIAALAAVFFTVYIATGKSDYEITVEKQTELSKQRLYRYVNNLQNFSAWNPWNNDATVFKIDSIVKGDLARVSWQSNEAIISKSVLNDSVNLDINFNGYDYVTTMYFTDQKGKAKIAWNIKGKLSFSDKFKIFFKGTPESIYAPTFSKALTNIDKNITESLKNFSIKNEGIVFTPETIYIKQVVESHIEDLGDKIFQSMERMSNFAKNFELEPYGSPFTMFESLSVLSGNVRYSVCLPIKNFFSTAEGSDIVCETLPAFYGYKTVLTGDYIHSDKAWEAVKKAIISNRLTERSDLKSISIYKNSILSTSKTSEWTTEFIIPVNETVIPIIDEPTDSLSLGN